MLSRRMSTPATISLASMSLDSVAGPRVAMILVWRKYEVGSSIPCQWSKKGASRERGDAKSQRPRGRTIVRGG